MNQDLNQKIKIGTVRSQLGKRALAHPNLAEGGGGRVTAQWGCYKAETPRKNLKALNCI